MKKIKLNKLTHNNNNNNTYYFSVQALAEQRVRRKKSLIIHKILKTKNYNY